VSEPPYLFIFFYFLFFFSGNVERLVHGTFYGSLWFLVPTPHLKKTTPPNHLFHTYFPEDAILSILARVPERICTLAQLEFAPDPLIRPITTP